MDVGLMGGSVSIPCGQGIEPIHDPAAIIGGIISAATMIVPGAILHKVNLVPTRFEIKRSPRCIDLAYGPSWCIIVNAV